MPQVRHLDHVPVGSMIRFANESEGSPDERGRICALVTALLTIREMHDAREIVLTMHSALADPAEIASVHTNWRPEHLNRVETPGSLPRRETCHVCPKDSRLVEVQCIREYSGGMGSYYGFEGYFLSLIINPDLREVIDARGEQAS